ncbi:hypothetical protein BDW75DRAFT_224201, partial [Aspergillus navahoensis]
RLANGRFADPKKKAKADRERFCRNKWACFKWLNELYLDGLDYTTYNSHPEEEWVPSYDAVVSK